MLWFYLHFVCVRLCGVYTGVYIYIYIYIYVYKVKQSHYRPRGAQRFPGSEGSQISWQQHRMVVGCQPYAPAAFTPRKYSWYSFLLEAELIPVPLCDRKDFMSMKNPLTLAGIEPSTFWFVAQRLNHCATAVPSPPPHTHTYIYCRPIPNRYQLNVFHNSEIYFRHS